METITKVVSHISTRDIEKNIYISMLFVERELRAIWVLITWHREGKVDSLSMVAAAGRRPQT